PGQRVLADTGLLVLVVDPNPRDRETESPALLRGVLESPGLALRPQGGSVVRRDHHDPGAGPFEGLVDRRGQPVPFRLHHQPEKEAKTDLGGVPEPVEDRPRGRVDSAGVLPDRRYLEEDGRLFHVASGSSSRFSFRTRCVPRNAATKKGTGIIQTNGSPASQIGGAGSCARSVRTSRRALMPTATTTVPQPSERRRRCSAETV